MRPSATSSGVGHGWRRTRPPATNSDVARMVEDVAAGDELRHGTWMVGPPAMMLWCSTLIYGRYHLIPCKYHFLRGKNRMISDRYHLIPVRYQDLIPRKYHPLRGKNRMIPDKYHLIPHKYHLIRGRIA
uniref:Uncharacterized protein n=1 Tax=Oryza nivara TaxID=4536 RepID=A0A0E0H3W0_ORYNI